MGYRNIGHDSPQRILIKIYTTTQVGALLYTHKEEFILRNRTKGRRPNWPLARRAYAPEGILE